MTSADELADVWKALADPTRRQILDLLSQSPKTTGQIAETFPISRVAVMKHLRLLCDVGLVLDRKRGRERWHYINLAPLQRIYERWFRPHEAAWAVSLNRLKEHVEGGDHSMPIDETHRLPLGIDIEMEIFLAAPRTKVFRALTDEIAAWWGHPYLYKSATDLVLEAKLGGSLYEVWGEDAGCLLGTVSTFQPNLRLEITGRIHVGVAYGIAEFQLEDQGDQTLLKFSHKAFGDVSAETATEYEAGWQELLRVRLKAFVETGESMSVAAAPKNP